MEERGLKSFTFSPFFVLFIWLFWGALLLSLGFLLKRVNLVKSSYGQTLLFIFLFYAFGFLLVWFSVFSDSRHFLIELLNFNFSAFLWGIAAFFLFFLFTNFYGYLVGFLGYDINKAYDYSFFFSRARGWWLFPTFLVVGFLGPLTEEFFFRGYLYLYLRKKKGFLIALIVSSLLFSLLHLSFLFFIPFLFFGILSALMLEKRGSLDASLIFHILNNVLALLAYLFLKV